MKFSVQALIVSSLALPSEGFSTGNAGRAKTNQQVFTTVSTTKLSSTTDADLERERISALPLPPSSNQ